MYYVGNFDTVTPRRFNSRAAAGNRVVARTAEDVQPMGGFLSSLGDVVKKALPIAATIYSGGTAGALLGAASSLYGEKTSLSNSLQSYGTQNTATLGTAATPLTQTAAAGGAVQRIFKRPNGTDWDSASISDFQMRGIFPGGSSHYPGNAYTPSYFGQTGQNQYAVYQQQPYGLVEIDYVDQNGTTYPPPQAQTAPTQSYTQPAPAQSYTQPAQSTAPSSDQYKAYQLQLQQQQLALEAQQQQQERQAKIDAQKRQLQLQISQWNGELQTAQTNYQLAYRYNDTAGVSAWANYYNQVNSYLNALRQQYATLG